jgi:subfamily B ATP-binding cassette protein HlyB/CyaB
MSAPIGSVALFDAEVAQWALTRALRNLDPTDRWPKLLNLSRDEQFTLRKLADSVPEAEFQARITDLRSLKHVDRSRTVALVTSNGKVGVLIWLAEAGLASVEYEDEPIQRGQLDAVLSDVDPYALLIGRRLNDQNASTDENFGLGWFASALLRHRTELIGVIICSVLLQFFSLAFPLLFQVVIDRVLIHKTFSTLAVVTLAMLLVTIFEGVTQQTRAYLINHTSNRIDVELGARLFSRLLRLPISYFETRPAGHTVARIREIESIRNFLTGSALTSTIDLAFMAIAVAILFLYSPILALTFLLICPLYILVALIVRPLMRRRIEERFNRGAASQQFQVETVIGVSTVKTSAAERPSRDEWERRLASYVNASFKTQMLGTFGQTSFSFLSRLTTILILFVGAHEVMAERLTVGGLVAFNMIASQIVSPLLRIATVWQDFQQIQISISRLRDIWDAEPEWASTQVSALRGALRGKISFKNVAFEYTPGAQTLRDVNLFVEPGSVVGIVGESGSGKSTLVKLLNRTYLPGSGQVLIDGIDIAKINPRQLRRRIGFVQQENFLFNRTIAENIAFGHPEARAGQIQAAAKLSGAHDFIMALPEGYRTQLHERGTNLSGGQRQRIAIARALIRNPKILIFDEATSALDYESELIIQNNMKRISEGRTVFVVAHRLSTVRDCDIIVGMANGRIREIGSHDELIAQQDGVYARLWRLQSGERPRGLSRHANE